MNAITSDAKKKANARGFVIYEDAERVIGEVLI